MPPIADAGPDEVIQLPNNTVILDGSASSDDIAIVSYEWMTDPSETKPISMQGGDTSIVLLSDLEEGVYTLTLKVTDDAGLTSLDTVQVTVQGSNGPKASLLHACVHLLILFFHAQGRNFFYWGCNCCPSC